MITIKDVALRAKVSISTVSYVLSGKRPISEKTKARILTVMEEIGYQPNAIAQGLARGKTGIIALLMSSTKRDLGKTELEFVNGAAAAAHEAGYHLVLWTDPVETPSKLESMGQRGMAEGVLLMEVTMHDWRAEVLTRLGIPCAMIGRPSNSEGYAWVDIDFEATVACALDALESAGHRQLVLINQSRKTFDQGYGPAVRIQESFMHQCAKRGLSGMTVFCESEAKAGLDTVRLILKGKPKPTALLTMNDPALSGIMHGIREAGLAVPEDISVLALLSSPAVADCYWPPLSTMDVPGAELGRLGITRLVHQIEAEGSPPESATMLPCTLSLRGTTAQRKKS